MENETEANTYFIFVIWKSKKREERRRRRMRGGGGEKQRLAVHISIARVEEA